MIHLFENNWDDNLLESVSEMCVNCFGHIKCMINVGFTKVYQIPVSDVSEA